MKIYPYLWTKKTKLTIRMRNVFYKSWMWQKKRDTVLERDGYLCQVCLRADEPVPADTVHHIVHLKDNPSLALVDTNLISVCFPCHNDLHPEKGFGMKNEKKFSNKIKVFEVNQNPEQPW